MNTDIGLAASPSYSLFSIILVVALVVAFYVGIIIRHYTFPSPKALPLPRQFLLGIPIALLTLPPLYPVLRATVADVAGLLVTLGVVMEQGMILTERGAQIVHNALQKGKGGKP